MTLEENIMTSKPKKVRLFCWINVATKNQLLSLIDGVDIETVAEAIEHAVRVATEQQESKS